MLCTYSPFSIIIGSAVQFPKTAEVYELSISSIDEVALELSLLELFYRNMPSLLSKRFAPKITAAKAIPRIFACCIQLYNFPFWYILIFFIKCIVIMYFE